MVRGCVVDGGNDRRGSLNNGTELLVKRILILKSVIAGLAISILTLIGTEAKGGTRSAAIVLIEAVKFDYGITLNPHSDLPQILMGDGFGGTEGQVFHAIVVYYQVKGISLPRAMQRANSVWFRDQIGRNCVSYDSKGFKHLPFACVIRNLVRLGF